MLPHVSRAGGWFLGSGIQEANGGVARYYCADRRRNLAVSTEITGYAVSTLVYLHSLTKDPAYLDRARLAARFLTGTAWDAQSQTMPFEIDPPAFTYFFDCGIIVRGLLAAWRATGTEEFLGVATALGRSMAADFAMGGPLADVRGSDPDHARGSDPNRDYHPILELPGKRPLERDALRWSRSPGCYQLKSAMAWWDLWEATGDERCRRHYDDVLVYSLRTYARFLPGHPDRSKVMDRLHAFLYFLEGLLPRADEARCAAALCAGIGMTATYLREIAPEFERSDVYAQLLRIRLYADAVGAVPLDRDAAAYEAERLAGFQLEDGPAWPAEHAGGYCFGKRGDTWLPYVNPVSTAFALQARALWDAHGKGEAPPHRHLLI